MMSFMTMKLLKRRLQNCELKMHACKEELESAQKRPAAGSAGTTNFDILKRISNLEKHVFGSKLFDQE